VIAASEAERRIRKAARRANRDWAVAEVRGKGGRKRGKGSHKMLGLFDEAGIMLAWTTIPQHPGDLSPVVIREIEAAFEPYFGKEWMAT
jgi:hypothetical protein